MKISASVQLKHRCSTPHLLANIVLDTQNRDSYTLPKKKKVFIN